MIKSKPKRVTIFSLSLFLILAYGTGIWSWFRIPSSPAIWYVLPFVCLSIAIAVSVKLLLGYRVLVINGNHWQVNRLVGRDIEFNGNQIEWWREIEIKTTGDMYKQLHIHAGNGKNVKVSLQEHSEYQKVLKWLKTKYLKQQISEPN